MSEPSPLTSRRIGASLRRLGRRLWAHFTRRVALLGFVVVAIAVWVVGKAGSDSAVGQGALVVVGTLISFILLPDEPHRLWNVDAKSLAETVPPEKLAFAGTQVAGAMAIQAGGLVPIDVLEQLWGAQLVNVNRIAAHPDQVARDLDYRILITPMGKGAKVRTEIRSERFLPGISEVVVSLCSDYDGMSEEFDNRSCILRERVERRFDESPADWVTRVSAYPVQLQVGGSASPLLRREPRTIGGDDSMVLRFVFSAGSLQSEFTDVRLKVTWETDEREFPVKFSSYTCVGTTNVSFEVADTSCSIQYNEYFSAAARPVNVERSSTSNSQQLTIAAPRGTVLPPGSGAVFTWIGRRTRLLQSPQLLLDGLPAGSQLRAAGPLPSTRRPADAASDPLVDVTGLRIVDSYSLLGILPSRQFRVRSTVLERLHKADDLLPDGFDLVVLDAWRSIEDQRQLLDHYSLDESGSQYVASVTGGGMRPPHVTGGAVDVTVAWKGVPLALGTDYDSFDHSAHYDAFEASDGVPRRLRRILSAAMSSAGFAPYQFEWWHWSYGDDVWAEFVGADSVPFELIEQV